MERVSPLFPPQFNQIVLSPALIDTIGRLNTMMRVLRAKISKISPGKATIFSIVLRLSHELLGVRYYPTPSAKATQIKSYIAFYKVRRSDLRGIVCLTPHYQNKVDIQE